MIVSLVFFLVSFLGDTLAALSFQRFLDGGKKDYLWLYSAIIFAILVWIFYFGLQARGFGLRLFIPLWASGAAVFGYFAGAIFTHTPLREIFHPVSLLCITAIGLGIFFLSSRIPMFGH